MYPASRWNLYRTRFLVRARQLTEPLSFRDALGREHSGQPGDYLVESGQGMLRITAKAIFEDIYVPLSRNGSSQSKKLTLQGVRPTPAALHGRPSLADDGARRDSTEIPGRNRHLLCEVPLQLWGHKA
jgi:hypothetical protein